MRLLPQGSIFQQSDIFAGRVQTYQAQAQAGWRGLESKPAYLFFELASFWSPAGTLRLRGCGFAMPTGKPPIG